MSFDNVDPPQPADTGVLIKIEAAGINYIDTYQRSGLYQVPLPTTLGLEASGTVEGIGSDVGRLKIGDRVA
jgi:NADPH2:quinone reductase